MLQHVGIKCVCGGEGVWVSVWVVICVVWVHVLCVGGCPGFGWVSWVWVESRTQPLPLPAEGAGYETRFGWPGVLCLCGSLGLGG